jgi:hypothetical protein
MGEIVIEEANYKAFAIAMANLFLLLAAIAITIMGIIEHKAVFKLSGIAVALVFLIGFIKVGIKAMDVKRLLTITMDGIIDNSSIGGVGFISFDDIKEFQIVTLYNKHVIAVIPKNMDVFLSKLPAVKRRQAKRNVRLDLPPVSIMVNMAKDMEPEDILSLLKKRLSDYSQLYD